MHGMRRHHFSLIFIFSLLVSGIASAGGLEAMFAPRAEPWELWMAHAASSTEHIDHQPWDTFLSHYVQEKPDGINRLPYATVTAADKTALANYINTMQAVAINNYNRKEQLAYWINLYNAETIQIVLQHYPVDSIRDIDISPGFFADGPWGETLLKVNQQPLSLNDIEHRILRPGWKDPRIHYAVNCASLGCPNLRNRAFTADNLEDMLNTAAREYINHPRGVKIDEGSLYVSSIYSWFESDFGNNAIAVIQHLKHYARPELAKALDKIDFINGDNYNWSLNDSQPEEIISE
jgi:hypothetical protein